ncbi:hypothetical protein M011DRAFT_405227 [Sporormia fimetaria CBS 119925]|uniref:Uncharacterized protein n=1 Tax=Sporormia fimetaria CBS 119925 TaxID=1340428 RepID=A0A6A6V7U9_9PLEO|nr:hypothetical protein M011DRAFT_405227 [Sporormia fimetaria CBS 119925]
MSVDPTTSSAIDDDTTPLSRIVSPSSLPDLSILPLPLPASALPVGQLVSKHSQYNPTTLSDRDYDDAGTRWYKDVVLLSRNGEFIKSLGGVLYIPKPSEGTEVGTIEAREMIVRMLKDPEAALRKVLSDEGARRWIEEQEDGAEIGFVTAVREVVNPSYRHATLVDRGAGNWEVVRAVGGQGQGGQKRRGSGLDVDTGSKMDAVGVIVKELVVGESVRLGEEELGTGFWVEG